jgi:hypothetical protein
LSQSRLITEPKAQGSRIKCSLEEWSACWK